jgi:hypothetical protein
MPVKPITEMTSEELVVKLDALKEQTVRASVAFARVIAESFHRELWEEYDVPMAEFYANHGVSADDPLPTLARREVIELTPTATLAQHMTLTGASKATVARDRSLAGITDKAKADAIAQGKGKDKSAGGQNGDRSKTSTATEKVSAETPDFDLGTLLSALDDAELVKVLASSLPTDRIGTLIENLTALAA